MKQYIEEIIFKIGNSSIVRKISGWWFSRQLKRHGVVIGGGKYKTIQEAIDAGERYIIVNSVKGKT